MAMKIYWFLLDDGRRRPFLAPVRNRREAEAVLLSMFGDRLREVGPKAPKARFGGRRAA